MPLPERRSILNRLQERPGACILLSGCALGFSFPPFPAYGLAWMALGPLLLRWTEAPSARRLYLEALGMWLITSSIAFSWPVLHPSPITALASLGGVLVLCMIGAVPFALSVPVRIRLGLLPGLSAFIAFALATEWILKTGPLAFPWMLYGHTQAAAVPFNQLAALGGSAGLSLWVLMLNAALLLAALPRYRTTALFGIFLALIAAVGFGSHRRATPPPAADSTDAMLVQPGLTASTWAKVHSGVRVRHLQRLTASALSPQSAEATPLVIWPETALPPEWSPNGDSAAALQQWVDRHRIELLTGAIRPAAPPTHQRYYNSAVLLSPDRPPQVYNKNRLVPFAERVPFIDRIPALRSLAVPAGGVAGYEQGRRRPLLGTTFKAGVLICFESTFDQMVRTYAAAPQSADFLVTLAQDGWWGPSAGYRQHFAFTRLRAIETGRAVAMVTVTGITALIGPRGDVMAESGWMDQTTRQVSIPHYRDKTVFIQWGAWIDALGLGFAALFLVWVLIHPRLASSTTAPSP